MYTILGYKCVHVEGGEEQVQRKKEMTQEGGGKSSPTSSHYSRGMKDQSMYERQHVLMSDDFIQILSFFYFSPSTAIPPPHAQKSNCSCHYNHCYYPKRGHSDSCFTSVATVGMPKTRDGGKRAEWEASMLRGRKDSWKEDLIRRSVCSTAASKLFRIPRATAICYHE